MEWVKTNAPYVLWADGDTVHGSYQTGISPGSAPLRVRVRVHVHAHTLCSLHVARLISREAKEEDGRIGSPICPRPCSPSQPIEKQLLNDSNQSVTTGSEESELCSPAASSLQSVLKNKKIIKYKYIYIYLCTSYCNYVSCT